MREKRRDDFFIAAKLLMPMTFASKSLFALDNSSALCALNVTRGCA
jgi:hypothetical protein